MVKAVLKRIAVAAIIAATGLGFAAPGWANTPPSSATASVGAATAGPEATVTSFDSALLNTMKAGKNAGMDGRMKIMRSAVKSSFDLRGISEIVLGPYWAKLSTQQHKTFMQLFENLIVTTYASNFNSYSNQTFKLVKTAHRGNQAYVATQFINPGSGKRHNFDYVLRQSKGQWRIVNVIADGVSDVAVKRAQYTALLQKGSFADLEKALKKKIASVRKGS